MTTGGLMLISHPDAGKNWTWVYGFQVWGNGEPRWCCVCACLRFWGSRSGLFGVYGGYSWLDLPVRDYLLFMNREQGCSLNRPDG